MVHHGVQVKGFDAKVGKQGHIRVQGTLPVTALSVKTAPTADAIVAPVDSITMDIKFLKLRMPDLYSGE